jgi:hypothetical protein
MPHLASRTHGACAVHQRGQPFLCHLQRYALTDVTQNINYNQLWSVLPSQWFISSQYRK